MWCASDEFYSILLFCPLTQLAQLRLICQEGNGIISHGLHSNAIWKPFYQKMIACAAQTAQQSTNDDDGDDGDDEEEVEKCCNEGYDENEQEEEEEQQLKMDHYFNMFYRLMNELPVLLDETLIDQKAKDTFHSVEKSEWKVSSYYIDDELRGVRVKMFKVNDAMKKSGELVGEEMHRVCVIRSLLCENEHNVLLSDDIQIGYKRDFTEIPLYRLCHATLHSKLPRHSFVPTKKKNYLDEDYEYEEVGISPSLGSNIDELVPFVHQDKISESGDNMEIGKIEEYLSQLFYTVLPWDDSNFISKSDVTELFRYKTEDEYGFAPRFFNASMRWYHLLKITTLYCPRISTIVVVMMLRHETVW